jgi:hypothetical protein
MTHPVLEHFSRFRVRWAVAGGVAVAALALTAFAVGGRGASEDRLGDGPGLNIAVVPPVERDVQPGDVMDVGRLNDGFDGKMPEPVEQVSADADLYAEQPAYVESDQGWRAENRPDYDRDRYERDRYAPERERPADPAPPETFRGRPMSFGFDQPQPDWRAEREARRAALDARERDRRDRRERSSDLRPDSEFY